MGKDSLTWEALRFAAMRRLDLVSPKDVVNWATLRVGQDEGPESLVDLASEAREADALTVDAHLARICNEFGLQEFDDVRAGLVAACDLAAQIVSKSVEPEVGARRIWWDVARRVPALEPRLRVFIGLVSEWDDDAENRPSYSAEILLESESLLRMGAKAGVHVV